MKLRKITCRFKGVRCATCRTPIAYETQFYWDKYGVQGKKNFCVSCGENRDASESIPDSAKPYTEPENPPENAPKPAESGIDGYFQHMFQHMIDTALEQFEAPAPEAAFDEVQLIDLIEKHAVKRIIFERGDGLPAVDMGLQHFMFPDLMKAIQARDTKGYKLNFWIGGPAGSGKTSCAEYAAKSLGLDFWVTGALMESHKLFGFISAVTGQYVTTGFRKLWEHGGVIVLDDADRSDAVCMTEFNAAFANGTCSFPDGMVPRHKDCVIILTANTWGLGSTSDYVGASKQDAAFVDRFVFIDWQYDEALETATCGNPSWAKRVQSIRKAAKSLAFKVLVTPRASYNGAALLAAGMEQDKVERMTIFNRMTVDQHAAIMAQVATQGRS